MEVLRPGRFLFGFYLVAAFYCWVSAAWFLLVAIATATEPWRALVGYRKRPVVHHSPGHG